MVGCTQGCKRACDYFFNQLASYSYFSTYKTKYLYSSLAFATKIPACYSVETEVRDCMVTDIHLAISNATIASYVRGLASRCAVHEQRRISYGKG